MHPELLGIGIDEATAIHVQGNELEVVGPGRVLIHNGESPFSVEGGLTSFKVRAAE